MTSVVEHRIEIAGHATRALEVDGGGPGIVLLHGWGDSADTWRPLLAQLGARGRRAIAVDLPGFGEATRLHDGAVLPQLDAFALDLVESWADKEPVVVAGTSLGGCIALRLAEHPGNVRLVGVVPVSPDGLELPSWFDPIEEDPIVRKLLSIPVPVPGILVRRARSSAYRQLSYNHPSDTQRHVVDAFSRDGETRADLAMLLGSGRRLAPELSNAPFDLVGIRCPVLLVWGAHDRTLPHTDARIALDSLPTTHVELIEGAGRHPQLDATSRLLELLLPFGT
ncbi:alpha/beta fold hydrolase [Solirubrobacter ginsenosidimutans]|uniref:Alpha/beta fold hydrolase n=1 Tax=Solirubrobacter ginsenosidimutans TaxID=490573 RepID=A0A9X3MXJ0_9ACTN|nr:alpha/beta fold hydrolase [Solirubrobacter ginsenosidimutans]MDA0163218.1 alpha/beta fold hydrolase [Solirubrobacter ginsenosidimutans]